MDRENRRIAFFLSLFLGTYLTIGGDVLFSVSQDTYIAIARMETNDLE